MATVRVKIYPLSNARPYELTFDTDKPFYFSAMLHRQIVALVQDEYIANGVENITVEGQPVNSTCEECGHKLEDHKPVCDAERLSHVEGIEASGPCGCKAFVEEYPRPPYVANR